MYAENMKKSWELFRSYKANPDHFHSNWAGLAVLISIYQIFSVVFWKIDDFLNTFWHFLTFDIIFVILTCCHLKNFLRVKKFSKLASKNNMVDENLALPILTSFFSSATLFLEGNALVFLQVNSMTIVTVILCS